MVDQNVLYPVTSHREGLFVQTVMLQRTLEHLKRVGRFQGWEGAEFIFSCVTTDANSSDASSFVTTKRDGKTDKKEGKHQTVTPLNTIRNVSAQIQVKTKK